MNDPREERELERFLAGDSPVSRQYEQLSKAEPPPELDAGILAAADAEVQRDDKVVVPLGRPWQRWATAVGLAASVMLAFAVVMQVTIKPFSADEEFSEPATVRLMEEDEQRVRVKRESEPMPRAVLPADAPAVASVADRPSRPSMAEEKAMLEEEVAAGPALADVSDLDTRVPVAAAAPQAPGGLASFGAAAPVTDEARLAAAVAVIRAERDVEPAREGRQEIVVTARRRDAADLAPDKDAAMPPPDEQLDEVLRLYEAGDTAGAAEQLARFVAAYPAHPVSRRLDELD